MLKITPALEQRLFCDGTSKAWLAANRAAHPDGIVISASGLATKFDALLQSCTAHYQAAPFAVRSGPKDESVAVPRLIAGFA